MGQRLSAGGRVTRALAQVSKRQQGEIDAAAAAASARAYVAKQQGMQDVGPGSVPEQRLPEEMREAQAAAARASRAPEVAQESGDEEDLAVIHEKDPRLVTQLMEVDGGAAIHSEPSSALQQQLSRYYLEQQIRRAPPRLAAADGEALERPPVEGSVQDQLVLVDASTSDAAMLDYSELGMLCELRRKDPQTWTVEALAGEFGLDEDTVRCVVESVTVPVIIRDHDHDYFGVWDVIRSKS